MEKLGQHQAVRYDKVVTNIGSAYDSRDGHFEAPVAGLYSFSLTGMAYYTTQIYLGIMKNNAELVRVFTTDGLADSASIMVHTHLDIGDHVWVENVGGAGSQLHDQYFNCFSGILDNQE